ncbi:BglG family transcription antiterminator [Floccifex sp.]|uniref:BglG family transcription antiterminator n=1 Tax=Floccifex sp. TaxID=2815810 RepID=UPI0029FF1DD5|nr:PTS sugar transporter subunit IIA [Floccifex sp.]MDD7281981.1 BglG family transcription antiterminator [Erysipelotrichaceae bacterium]MDY2957890.1 BglG family transcription antiterminator [Floccifex sp.]
MAINYNLDKRCMEILNIIMYTSGYLKIQDLADELQVSKRSVYYDISKINEWLEANDIDPLTQERGKGLFINKQQANLIQRALNTQNNDTYQIYTPDERMMIIICHIIIRSHPLYIDDFIRECQVSRNTIINDLKSADNLLSKYNLELTYDIKSGYRITGDIIKKRALFFMIFPNQLWNYQEKNQLFELDDKKVKHNLCLLKEIEAKLEAEYVTGILPSLAIFISSIENRNDEINFSDMDVEEIVETKEYQYVHQYFPNLKNSEQIYISLHLLGSRLQTIPVNVMKEHGETYVMAKNLVKEFERISCFYYDQEEELINAISAHLKTSLYRYRYGIQLGNPMLDSIKTEYEDLFYLTKKACISMQNQLDCLISDAEVAYLTLHFGAFMPQKKRNQEAFRILIICPNGIGTGNMLRQEVANLVPQATEITNLPLSSYTPDHDFDVVISTVVLVNEKRLIVVHPILTDQDRVAILRNCMSTEPRAKMQIDDIIQIAKNYIAPDQIDNFKKNLQEYYSSLQVNKVYNKKQGNSLINYLNPKHIVCVKNIVDWEQAIRLSCEPLIEDDSITQEYVDSIIEDQRDKGLHMFLADDLVLAHTAIEKGVKRLDVSLATFKKPVYFPNGKQARIIIVLCAEDKTKHFGILNDVLEIFSKKKSIEQIVNLDSSQSVHRYIENSLTKEK